ncbi:PREDICTED: NADH dehydrogenase [ubiquinone] flavoprotein 3, mitochondrial isoform X1 [Galeopterus variegatus]|uniref:NADH dehydrogenase [ubiquinone] flavoprotein 3, mitochondrial isoform X1 n=1 Tax=Galeopterus variegatus TaxID=482537 RepID=A0ABM0PZ66_GALVR|nr:PREDICTED: NADH dehydrogenase [ubiquinone] flavoprotein 3, mitochondrial isoform X1 [Galeopterus variegatus]
MAATLFLRQGRARALKTLLLAARVSRGLASTVSLSAESGKREKGPNSKKQSPPKNVVEPKERGKLLATQTAAELSKSLSSPSSYPSVVNKGGMVASPRPDDSMVFTNEGLPKFLSRKTLVEFPQKVSSPLGKQGSDSEAHREGQEVRDDSSSSSSSSSDSESDEEGDIPEADPRVVSKGKGGFPKPDASRYSEKQAPQVVKSAKEKTWLQKPDMDLAYPENHHQPKKKGTTIKTLGDRKDATPKTTIPKSQIDECLKQNVKEKRLQKILRSEEIDEERQRPFEVKGILPNHTKPGLSAQQSGSPVPTLLAEEARAGGQPQATPPGAGEGQLGKQVPEPNWKVASPLFQKENLGKQVVEGHLKATEEILEDQVPVRNLETVPVENEDVFNEKTAVLRLEEKGERGEDSATHMEDPDCTQEAAPTLAPAEPSDTTTYKNLQHHDYTMFTFLDLNLDLSKFRLPQPSTGRESPRH